MFTCTRTWAIHEDMGNLPPASVLENTTFLSPPLSTANSSSRRNGASGGPLLLHSAFCFCLDVRQVLCVTRAALRSCVWQLCHVQKVTFHSSLPQSPTLMFFLDPPFSSVPWTLWTVTVSFLTLSSLLPSCNSKPSKYSLLSHLWCY